MDDNNLVRPAGPGGRIWHVLDAAGNQIGACSSREDALRLAALAGGGAAPPVRSEGSAGAGPGERDSHSTRKPMFEWYAAGRRPSAWARLKGFWSRAKALSRRPGRVR